MKRLQRWRVHLTDGERREVLTFPASDEAAVRAAVANWLIDRPWWRVERIERVGTEPASAAGSQP